MAADASSLTWVGPIGSFAGVIVGGGVTYFVQARLQDRQKADHLYVTHARLTTMLRIAESRFELVARIGGYPIEREAPFRRLFPLAFSDDVAALVRARNAEAFYDTFAELEQAYHSMWYEFAELDKSVERRKATNDDRLRQQEYIRTEECRTAAKAAAVRAGELCRELRVMLGDLSNATLVKIQPTPLA